MEMILAFVVFILFFLGMSIGYLLKGRPLKGSCGGVANLMGNESCEICGGDTAKCEAGQQSLLANDATRNATEKAGK